MVNIMSQKAAYMHGKDGGNLTLLQTKDKKIKSHKQLANELHNRYGLLMCNWIGIIETLKLFINGLENFASRKKTKWVYKNGKTVSDSYVIKHLEYILTRAPNLLAMTYTPHLIQKIKEGLSARHKLVHFFGELTRRYIEKNSGNPPLKNITIKERQLRILERYEWRIIYACEQVDKALLRISVHHKLKLMESESKKSKKPKVR